MSPTMKELKREWEEEELRYGDVVKAKSNSSANDVQVGGSHYKNKKIQPWDFIIANELGFLEGNIVKYIARWKDKGGVKDLEKARHYLEKLIEVVGSGDIDS